MTEIAVAKKDIALSSENGKVWTDINGNEVNAVRVEDVVTRVVIGKLGTENKIEHGVELLREAFSLHRATITHLHLWNLKNLESLETLPPKLQCLDLRGCSALTTLPDLPESLETLDLKGCEALESLPDRLLMNLRYLHLDGCTGLDGDIINTRIRKSPALRELTLSRLEKLDGLSGLNGPGNADKDLRKLVLNDCSELTGLPSLEPFELLNHLNLNGCAKLAALPDLPVLPDPDPQRRHDEPVRGLRYLVTNECESLREYRGLDLRAVHLSQNNDDNIIDTVRAFRYLGDEPANLLSSKLLLLGSGRVGKTTLAKALQWADLTAAERDTENGRNLNPCLGSSSTHGIHFWPWECEFHLSDGVGKRTGRVHIWDFAGQEIYHNTHRLFAASGAVFIIVCCDPDTHAARLEKEMAGMSAGRREQFLDENAYRQVSYWLDYVRAALGVSMVKAGSLPVILVHSAERRADSDYLLEQAGPYRDFIDVGISRISLNCSDEGYVDDKAFDTLKKKLSFLLGPSADQLGIHVPAFYAAVHGLVEKLLRDGDPLPEDAVLTFKEWQQRLEGEMSDDYPDLAFQESVMSAVTRYLHRIGQLFWLDQQAGGDVLIDQKLGAQAIYTLCISHASAIRANEGLTTEEELGRLLARELRADRLDVPRMLRLLVKCDACAEIRNGQWQALNPALLPDLDPERAKSINAQWFQLVRQRSGYVNHCFRLSGKNGMMIGSSDLQAVMAWIARGIRAGEQGDGLPRWLAQGEDRQNMEERAEEVAVRWRAEWRYWRNGVQICWHPEFAPERGLLRQGVYRDSKPGESAGDPFLLRIQYAPFDADDGRGPSYAGSLYVEMLTRDEADMAERLETALFSDDGPLSFFRENKHIDDERPDDHPAEWAAHPRDSAMWPWAKGRNPSAPRERHEVAISVRGVDAEIAEALLEALEVEGISTYYYREDERLKLKQDEDESGLLRIYDYLSRAKCLIMVCTTDYFDLSKTQAREGNLYCPVELAEAICSLQSGEKSRSPAHILPFAASMKSKPFNWSAFDKAVTDTLGAYQEQVIEARGAPESDIDSREQKVVGDALRKLDPFLTKCGHQARNVVLWDERAESLGSAIQSLVDKVKQALRESTG